MKRLTYTYICMFCMLTAFPAMVSADTKPEIAASTKAEYEYITDGNKLFNQKRYAQAEEMYRKALEASPNSDAAKYNLAAALMHQTVYANGNTDSKPIDEAKGIFTHVAQSGNDKTLAEKAAYNLGNISFLEKNYAGAVDAYKNALRKNPNNEQARQNLMLALKELEKQNQNQNQNQNQDQDQEQNKDKDKNQDQNQNQNNQDQNNQDQQNNKNQQQQQDKSQQQQSHQGGISDRNAEKILNTMEKEEAMTRKRVEGEKSKEKNAGIRMTDKPW